MAVASDPTIDIINVGDLQAWLTALQLPAIPPDQLQQMVSAMSASMSTWLGYNPIQATYDTSFDGRGTTKVAFPNGPVTAVSSLTIDGYTIPACVAQTDFGYVIGRTAPYQSWLGLRGCRFSRGMQNCAVSYTAGFTADSLPANLVGACREAITALSILSGREPGLIEEKVGGLEERYAPPTAGGTDVNNFVLTPTITLALAPLRRVVPAW